MRDFFSLPKEEREKVVAKFNNSIDKNGPNGCWIWTGFLNDDGYGRLCHFKFDCLAHRLSWIIRYNCPIPEGLLCIHSCDVRNCVRPEHIALGTNKQNLEDRVLKDRSKKKPLVDRLKIAEAVVNGSSLYAAAKLFNIGAATVRRYMNTKEVIDLYGKMDFNDRLPINLRKKREVCPSAQPSPDIRPSQLSLI